MTRMNDSKSKTTLKAAVVVSLLVLFAAATGFGQQQVNLTAGPTTTATPDGVVQPMWGYTCGTAVTGSTATCAPLAGSMSGAATGALGGIYVLNGGSGYTGGMATTVTITPAAGNTPTTPAVAMAIVEGGVVVGFNVTNHGAGYTAAPTVTITDTSATAAGATAAAAPAWSPVLITVPYGATGGLQINLTNSLSFPTSIASGAPTNNIPTSIVIIGQVGGGLGVSHTTTPSPNHTLAQGCPTWFIANPGNPGVPCTAPVSGASGTPPAQGPRVQSMATEVAAATTTSLSWPLLRPGTYLLESGTHPSIQVPMGLIGMLVVTTPPSGTTAGTAYPAVTVTAGTSPASQAAVPAVQYNAEAPLEFSEIDPVQNKAVDLAVRTLGFSETAVWNAMTPVGGGAIAAVTVTNGGAGYSYPASVTFVPPSTTTGGATGQVILSFGVTIAVTNGGSGYSPTPTVTLTGCGTATPTVVSGAITAITFSGGCTSVPPVVITDATGTGATATATLAATGSVAAINISSPGVGYTSASTVTISGGSGTGATVALSVGTGGCGTTSNHTCYPPAVNYTPFYFLINGQAFDKTHSANSLFAATAGTQTVSGVTSPVTMGIADPGVLLLRMVNAGLRMHTPSIVGSTTTGFTGAGVLTTSTNPVQGFTLIAEDGNPLPNLTPTTGSTATFGAPRVQTDVLMVPGKVYDVMVNTHQPITAALPVYARDLALSANSSIRDAGMLAYVGVNGGGLPNVGSGIFAAAAVMADTYNSVSPCASLAASCTPLVISDPSKGVIANDTNVYGVALSTPSPTLGTLTCNAVPSNPVPGICANGTFTYTPNAGFTSTSSDSFGYCANGAVAGSALCTTVALNASSLALAGSPTAVNQNYTSKMASFIRIPSPGLLAGNTDPSGLPLSVVVPATPPTVTLSGGSTSTTTLVQDGKGGFTLALGTPPTTAPITATFAYSVQNSMGVASTVPTCSAGSTAAGCVNVTFPVPSGLIVNVVDAMAYANCNGLSTCISGLPAFSDYRWIIEEDETFYVDPNCTTNSSSTTPGCPSVVGAASGAMPGTTTIPAFGVNFHTSTMNFVAQGCTGPLSCEYGQTMLDTRPVCTNPPTNTIPAGCSTTGGTHIPAVCDLGNGACRPDPGNGSTSGGFTWVNPKEVVLDPSKRYYISVLPGDAANPFPAYLGAPVCPTNGAEAPATNLQCGHTMSGAPIPAVCNILGAGASGPACTSASVYTQPVIVKTLPTPLPTGKLSVIVFEDDFPLNGEQDGGGGNGTVAPIEPGLGGFNLVLWDTYGGLGDVTGQDTYDDFNQPLSNSLAGTIDPVTKLDACPITANPNTVIATQAGTTGVAGGPPAGGITGMIVTCPKYEADGTTLSPLAGQAVIANLMPEKFSVQAYPGADRIARGEQWLQTNTLDGQHPHDSFIRIGEPSYFQEYGPAGYHVAIGFANPAIINSRAKDVCAGFGTPGAVGPCTNTITGQVDVQRLSRTPDQRLYPSGSRAGFAWTQCWVSLGDPDGEDFQFTFCDANGNFTFNNVPGGEWRLSIGDQWNDQIIDGLSTPANVGCLSNAPNPTPTTPPSTACPGGQTLNLGNIGVQQWQSNLYTRTYIDDNKNGIWDANEIGIPFIYTMIHYRDGHNSNSLTTDFNGIANFNESYPLFNWYVVESDSTRYKTTGVHTVYDAGGPADGSPSCTSSARPCGNSKAYTYLTNTYEGVPLPADLSVPGAVYCATADCSTEASGFASGSPNASSATASTGRIDPWYFGGMEGWAGLTGLSNWIDFGKAPYASCPPACATVTFTPAGTTTKTSYQAAENGGIHGFVGYASTRPFDDASQMIQQPWEPNVPRVTVNLYQEGFATDSVTPTLTLVDTTQSASWDDWAQGFYPGSQVSSAGGGGPLPYMNCPGQGTAATGAVNQDLFYFTLYDQPNFLDYYNKLHSVAFGATPPAPTPLPYGSQYKCYDAMHIGNQLQPAPYDGRYFFPSILGINGTSAGGLNTSLLGGVGVPNWSPTTNYAVGAVVMYQQVAYVATTTSLDSVPSTTSTAWAMTTTPTTFVKASMGGTNCTVCVANPDATDKWRVGTPMLPPGKYVVEVIMPPGYEVYKEEDKNLLIGDNFIAPVTQQFSGLGTYIYIVPDQASVASMYDPTQDGYNPTNYQDSTTAMGLNEELSGVPGFPGFQDPIWPCVGEQRVVPDYLSLFPGAKEVAPFAGATRPLCDRKEITLQNQASVSAKFFIYTSTHIASKFTGGITDDFTSEFDPFAPQFGEKFSPPNMPISTKDYLGNEISRVYSDHWGTYNGLTYSSWEVNPPNITGYSPTMMVQCMNDPGPIPGPNGTMIVDPLYNSAYSDFCYEDPFMPGLTQYLDTPVVPTEAFVGAAYNNVDCAYPDTTPAIAEVDGDQIGPWVSVAGNPLTITALGNVQVNNTSYAGPSANVAPFNQKTIGRHYGFGSCTTSMTVPGTCSNGASVTIGGVTAPIVSWSDTQIKVNVPSGVSNCLVQQQTQYKGPGLKPTTAFPAAKCGQLLITASNGKQSIDTVTVTIGGKAPTHVPANQTIQSYIDQAMPGDLLMIDPTCVTAGTTTNVACNAGAVDAATPTQTASVVSHNEMLLMWKPVRLQGVGAATSIIDASAFPAGKLLDPWRRHVNCFFGLTIQGVPMVGTGGTSPPFDPTGSGYQCPDTTGGPVNYFTTPTNPGVPQVDRLPLEAVVGWDATVNGNLAEQLQEPSLMGAYEGAGITVLAKGVWTSKGENVWTDTAEGGAFPSDALLLQNDPAFTDDEGAAIPAQNDFCTTSTNGTPNTTELLNNPYPSNFECNPSSIDGLTVRDSSQGGGGIFVHGWAHNLQIANNRVYNNAGTLSGGITVGQGEFPVSINLVATGTTPTVGVFALDAPGSCQNYGEAVLSNGTTVNETVVGAHLPYCLDMHVNVHNNYISNNSSLGDELFSGTLAGGGGASFCTGSDYYKFQYNWVCGNLSSAEGGGVIHLGFIYNGDIEHNTIVLNQSTNPTIPTNGGGIIVEGTPDTDPTCGTQIDADCPPGLSDGTGPNLVINANLIQANTAESGSGGGIRLQQVNGTDIATFPRGSFSGVGGAGGVGGPSEPNFDFWNNVFITNNIIVNNVAGWDGAGISLQDSLNVTIRNNTISSNDTLASSGVLTQSIGTPEASAPAGSCTQPGPSGPTSASCPQSAGVTSTPNSGVLTTTFTGLTITCPTGMPNCTGFSNPLFQNNLLWQNRAFYIGITGLGSGNLNQQNLISLFPAFSGTATVSQTSYGQCVSGVSYWDIGVRGDTAPNNHGSGFTLSPTWSVLTDPGDYTTGNNFGASGTGATATSNLGITSQYCNGARVPPNCSVGNGCGGPNGYGVPPGIVDASAPNPVFSLTPSATVDEGNNWINVSWGPLSLSDDSLNAGMTGFTGTGNYGSGPLFANYALNAGSPAIDYIPATGSTAQPHPTTDFFGNPRPDTGNLKAFDVGAIEYQHLNGITASLVVTPDALNFGSVLVGTTSAAQTLTLENDGTATATGITVAVTAPFSRPAGGAGGTCIGTLGAGATCTIGIVFTPTAAGPATGTATITANVTVNGSPVALSGTGLARPAITSFSPASGARGTTFTVTVTGTNFAAPATMFHPGSNGPVITNVVVVNSTTATATFMVPANSALGNHCVTITTPVATSACTASSNFVVTAGPLAFSGPAPALTTTTANTTTKTGFVTITNSTIASGPFAFGGAPTITKVGGAGGTFSVIAGGTCTATTTLAPGGSCTVNVQYAPGTSTATATANVSVTGTVATFTETQTSANFTAN